jgi:uncharacterized Tic20 family protein
LLKEHSDKSDATHKEGEKILAFIILLIGFLSVPVLLLTLVLIIVVDASFLIKLYFTRDWMDMLIAISLTVLSIVLAFCLKILIKWLRA